MVLRGSVSEDADGRAFTAGEGENMTSKPSQPEPKDPDTELPSDVPSPRRSLEEVGGSLAEMQTTMFKDLLTAQLTALESFERLISSTGPASEDLMNQFSREFMLGLFRLYPVGQEISRHSFSAMTELAKEFSTVLRSALEQIDGNGARRSRAGNGEARKAGSVPA
jgi:hypothetical protein